MKVFLHLLLLSFVACYQEDVENELTKRELDHRNNLALLNSIHFGNKQNSELNHIYYPSSSAVNVENPPGGTAPVTINADSLALGNPNPIQLTNALSFPQAQSSIPTPPLENNIFYFPGERTQNPSLHYDLTPGSSLNSNTKPNLQPETVNDIQDNSNVIHTYAQQNVVGVPQPYPVHIIKEVKVPQPYPVHITRTVQVPVQVKVPVEVPRPYAVKVPHPVPVPVHIKVPVPIEKPYPVQVIKTVAVPVEKPIYIRVPQPIEVPVPQPYPVGVPQPVQIQVPFIVRLPQGSGITSSFNVPNLESGSVPLAHHHNFISASASNFVNVPFPESIPARLPENPAINGIHTVVDPTPVPPLTPVTSTTVCSLCSNNPNESTISVTDPKLNLSNITGSGLLPPRPPSNLPLRTKFLHGLLKSYVSSKEGGIYRRSTKFQTEQDTQTWQLYK